MRKASLIAALAIVTVAGACKKTGEGEYQVQTPDVNVSTDTATVRTPTVEAGMKKDTIVVDRPTVDVKRPGEAQSTATPNRRP